MKTVKCTYCGSDLERSNQAAERYKNHFCNRECRGSYERKERVHFECANCGESIDELESQLRHGQLESGRKFCNRKCQQEWDHKQMPVFTCLNCGEDFERSPSRIKWTNPSFCCNECSYEYKVGEKHPNWTGGGTVRRAIRMMREMVVWRKLVLDRDEHTCQECGATDQIDVHHINEFNKILKEHNIQSVEEAKMCKELWDTKNGIALCIHCHAEKHPDMRHLFKIRIAC